MRVQRRITTAGVARWSSIPWQEADGVAGEVVVECGLSPDVRVILDLDDLDHLRAVIEAREP